jgi:hypothetical protein
VEGQLEAPLSHYMNVSLICLFITDYHALAQPPSHTPHDDDNNNSNNNNDDYS